VEEATGEDFVVALSDRDSERLEACFHPEIRMRALVPSGFQEQRGPSAVVARLNSWFAEAESIQVLEKNVYRVADRLHIRYRFRELYADGSQKSLSKTRTATFVKGKSPPWIFSVPAIARSDAKSRTCTTSTPGTWVVQVDCQRSSAARSILYPSGASSRFRPATPRQRRIFPL